MSATEHFDWNKDDNCARKELLRSRVRGELQAIVANRKRLMRALCLGILKGLHYLSKDICIPPAISLGQIGDVVSQYFDNHPGRIDGDFQEIALAAMRSARPCGGRSNI
jgi:hypothetical protein